MSDQLSLTLQAFRRGRRVRSKATGKEGEIAGTAMRTRSVRGKSRLILAVKIHRDDGTEAEAPSYALDVIDQDGKVLSEG